METRQRHAPTAVYHWFVHEARLLAPIPPLDAIRHVDQLGAWFRQHRPNAILAPDGWARERLEAFTRIPEETSLMIYGNRRPGFSGIDELPAVVGAAAIDLLTSCIQRGETSLPPNPKRVLITGRYMVGKTTRPRLPPAAE